MTSDPTIREQTYPYFLQEVPELLQALEQGLLNLRENCTLNQVNTLMRATHTLKGAAASVGLETITIVAHSLEDIFKALCRPDVSVDPDVEALLFEGFECLRLPLIAELTGGAVNDAEVIDRATGIFAQLQEKLGDCFEQEAYLPTSVELGFDVTQSIFEIGVAQRLEQLAAAIATAQPDTIATVLRTQVDVFLGLAESLNLPGFGAIAQAAIAALDNHPEQTMKIAEMALEDFRTGQAAVLEGDRNEGGQPCEALQQLASQHPSGFTSDLTSDLTSDTATLEITALTVNQESGLDDSQPEEANSLLLESIWGESSATDESSSDANLVPLTASLLETSLDQEDSNLPSQTSQPSQQSVTSSTSIPSKDSVPSPTVRVNVEHLERLSYSVGELLTNQNQQSLQTEQLQVSVRNLLTRLQQHQQLLSQFEDQINRRATVSQQAGSRGKGGKSKKKKHSSIPERSLNQPRGFAKEFDENKESHFFIRSLSDNAVQLAETADAIDLFTRQSAQILGTQQRLLMGTRSALIEARMLPLGDIFDRFPRILQQLETRHNKQVELSLQGTEVLADKLVVEKLYDPLLHLVRNAFDHGIEPAAVRQQRHKPEKGRIEICAYHHGRHLVIEVRDDGEGLDFELIRQRVAEQQLVPSEQVGYLTQNQLTDLLFEPGFSTASQINDLSGRGIGLDVVQNQVHALQGSIAVHSQPHQGTTFTLQIPLSLTIAKLFVCQAGGKTHALFADAIEQVLIPQADQIQEQYGISVLRWGKGEAEQQIPIYSLTEALVYSSSIQALTLPSQASPISKPKTGQVILLRYQGALLGLDVDQLVGEQELVIRPLETIISSPSYVYGASVLSDGRLTLVIDPIALIQRILNQQENLSQRSDRTSSTLMLPSRPQQQLPAQTYAAPTLPPTDETKPNKRILIVEDSITVRQGLVLTLQKAGYQIFQAKDGYEAIEKLQHQTNFELIICDLDMPRVNGFEFLRHCQQLPDLANIPVIILTSRSDEKHRLLASQLGAAAYMTKPYLEYKLLEMISTILEMRVLNSVSS